LRRIDGWRKIAAVLSQRLTEDRRGAQPTHGGGGMTRQRPGAFTIAPSLLLRADRMIA
jgi:hypothetical protein